MKKYTRLDDYEVISDFSSEYFKKLNFDFAYFTNWPNQSNKYLNNIITPYVKIVMITSGGCCFSFKENEYTALKNSIIIIPPFTMHSAKSFDNTDSFEIFFSVSNAFDEEQFFKNFRITKIRFYPDIIDDYLMSLLNYTYNICSNKKYGSSIHLDYIINTLLLDYISADFKFLLKDSTKSSEQLIIDKTILFLENNISKHINVKDIANHLNISKSYLYRCIKNIVDCSPSQFIIRFKMIKATQLLKDLNLSISEISDLLGFSSVFYFSSQFKKFHNLSPTYYRDNLKQLKAIT